MPNLLISHDLGTSGNKASLYDESGRLLASATARYKTRYFRGNWAEQDPADWWDAVCHSTQEVLKDYRAEQVKAIAFSGHMDGCLSVDKEGNPLYPHILWADQRSWRESNWIKEQISEQRLF
ncbi:MAG TPA: xylulokinase, partial [Fastidiosipila sp.]|nr:xylulokinase [Fastidiosipila sp.]